MTAASPLPFYDPDDLLRYYMVLGESLGSPKIQSVTQSLGQRCKRCGGGPWTIRSNGDPRPGRRKLAQVCASCDEPWDGEETHVLKEYGKRTPHRILEMGEHETAMMDDWHQVRAIVENRPRDVTADQWEFCTVALAAHIDPRIGTYENVVLYGQRHRPRWTWSVGRVRSGLETARRVLSRRGLREGLLVRARGVG